MGARIKERTNDPITTLLLNRVNGIIGILYISTNRSRNEGFSNTFFPKVSEIGSIKKAVNLFTRTVSEEILSKPNITSHSFRIGYITQLWKDSKILILILINL